jgi:hypothetical protein
MTSHQSTSISVDDVQRDGDSLQARIVAPHMTVDTQVSNAGAQDNTSLSSNSPVDAIYEHTLTSTTVCPVHEWLSPPVQAANAMGERLFVPQQMGESNVSHHPVAEGSPSYDSFSFIHHAPLLDQSIGCSWPLSTTLYPGYDLSDINVDLAPMGGNVSFESTGQLLEGGPNPFMMESPSLGLPTINRNTTKEAEPPVERLGQDSLKRIQQMWSGKGTSQPALLVWTLWNDITEHKAANILSDPAEPANLPLTPSAEQRSESGMDSKITERCRDRLLVFYSETQITLGRALASNVLSPSESQPGELSSGRPTRLDLSDIEFPSVETLDLSLKFYFRHVHLSLPFIHRPTFNASETPCLLLLPMILIGYSILDPYGSEPFVSHNRAVCLLDS